MEGASGLQDIQGYNWLLCLISGADVFKYPWLREDCNPQPTISLALYDSRFCRSHPLEEFMVNLQILDDQGALCLKATALRWK
ncbi:unnamed protein product [Lactuca virosa]|uniref:Uncharacterized protein n=1 Tax=Lactuca virosa TaxID=75947 RepID=A0AAU9M6W7_9ASTR|nr:unnamed protein product [Lactuca virosa]